MTYRNRRLLDLAHDSPCFLNISETCGQYPSVPCHSDMLRHGRGAGHKSGDHLAVAGCPACHALFTREHLGRVGYDELWQTAFEHYQTYLWESGKVKVA